jgi:hypothetical protein
MSAEERTGWRDEELSLRHRLYWGRDCPAVDVDFMLSDAPEMFDDNFRLVEYYHSKPKALIEYKHWNPGTRAEVMDHLGLTVDGWMRANYKAHKNLCDHYVCEGVNGLPYLVAFYRSDPWQFEVVPINTPALKIVNLASTYNGTSWLASEVRFVHFLYYLRTKSSAPDEVIRRLDNVQPESRGGEKVAS